MFRLILVILGVINVSLGGFMALSPKAQWSPADFIIIGFLLYLLADTKPNKWLP